MVLNDIDFDIRERKICWDCVDEIWGQVKSETLQKVGNRTMYGADESEDDDEEVKGTVIGGGSDEVNIMPVVYSPWDG